MIDVDRQIAAVARTVADREVDGRLAKVVVLAQTYPTDVEDLWDAVTDPERLPRWFAPVSGDLVLGGRYQVEGNAGGTITRCEAPHAFDATWEFGGGTSWIEVRLAAVDDDHARLELTHLAHPDEHWDQFGPGAVGIGWDLTVMGLFLHVDAASVRPPDAEVEAWSTSPDGIRFTQESGQAWIEADIAGGAEAEGARTRGAATIAAYTPPEG